MSQAAQQQPPLQTQYQRLPLQPSLPYVNMVKRILDGTTFNDYATIVPNQNAEYACKFYKSTSFYNKWEFFALWVPHHNGVSDGLKQKQSNLYKNMHSKVFSKK
ncbi:4608_t:CDS:2 [Ambispora leptoticha]|uniref:4608_t:CDS:1 n=1 Tax=Ambispora leptoticha TaxID=144679 RepID=A0A9N8YRC6_9GLOM|nr:4608_t:CDS:2 [Ambispora leptoticha]